MTSLNYWYSKSTELLILISITSAMIFTVSVLLIFLYFGVIVVVLNDQKVLADEPLTKTLGCHFLCVSKCYFDKKDIKVCEGWCKQSVTDQYCGEMCSGECGIMRTNDSILHAAPTRFNVTFAKHRGIEIDPKKAKLEWSYTNDDFALYLVEYGSTKNDSQNIIEHIIINTNSTTIARDRMCEIYKYRVAAATYDKITQFTDWKKLKAPSPKSSSISLWADVNKLDQPFYGKQKQIMSNETAQTIVHYSLPYGWKSEEILAEFHPVVVAISFGLDPQNLTADTLTTSAKFDLPGSVFDEYYYFAVVSLKSFTSICNTSWTFEPTQENAPTVIVRYLETPIIKRPVCNMNLKIEPKLNASGHSYKGVHFSAFLEDNRFMTLYPVKCFVIKAFRITRSPSMSSSREENSNADVSVSDDLIHWECLRESDKPPFYLNVTIEKQYISGLYSVMACAVYTNVSFSEWDEFEPIVYTLDLRQPTFPVDMSDHYKDILLLAVLLSGMALIIIIFVSLLLWRKCRKNRQMKLGKQITNKRTTRISSSDSNLEEKWETERDMLILNDDDKLGAGAFGDVFKGMLKQKQWIEEQETEESWVVVAIKMVPEYADEHSKSDFKREIAIMKKIGYHERLVNMLSCITKTEPLCLIVEYCSEGDLLHYLRDRRQYMVHLEQSGFDLKNINFDPTSDLNVDKVLCLRDILSFAWQISVGLEYLSLNGFIHRDVAARNVMVDRGKKIKVGDFGLCRYSSRDPIYVGRGGKLPIKWMALEAIKTYEFTTQSDVWSFGVLVFELITLGGVPYPSVQPVEMEFLLESGRRMEKPDNCTDELYELMCHCWLSDPKKRPTFSQLRETLRKMLESLIDDSSYIQLNNTRDYYNVLHSNENSVAQLEKNVERYRDPRTIPSNSNQLNETAKIQDDSGQPNQDNMNLTVSEGSSLHNDMKPITNDVEDEQEETHDV